MFLDKNPILYAGLFQVIKRGTAKILEETEEGIFLQDTVGGAYMMASGHPDTDIRWLKKHEASDYHLFSVFDLETAEFIKERYGLSGTLECFQAAFLSDEMPAMDGRIGIREATEDDIQMILEHYDRLEDWELKKIIERKELFIGVEKSEIGFVGMHLEGSIGLLEVFPEYRRKGYGLELEKFMVSHILEKKLIPFGQVETDNEKSLMLQKKLGMTISGEKVYWLFG